MSNLTVTSSPHIYTPRTTRSIMLDVLIALMPAAVASVIIFGISSLFVILACVISAVAAEFVFNVICRKEQTIGDLSSAVTGLLLALNIPSTIPLWQASIGAIFAIIVVKCLFGGIGQNFANPAITARIFLLLSFSGTMTAAVFPQNADVVSGATPLGVLSGQEGTLPTYLDLFLGCGAYFGGEVLLHFYSTDEAVVAAGLSRMQIICTAYFLCGIMDTLASCLRGRGYSVIPMIVSLVGSCLLRLVWIATIFRMFRSTGTLYISYPISWALTAGVHLICLLVVRKKMNDQLKEEARLAA